MEKIKVAFVIGGLPFGGVENWLFDLVSKLQTDAEIEPVVINISGTGEKVKDFIAANLPLINLNQGKKGLNTYRLDTVLKLRKVLRQIKPDIVHTLHFSGDYFGRLASLNLSTRVITHLHNIKREQKTHRRLANKLLSFGTDAYIGNSKAVMSIIKKDHNFARRECFLLYNSIKFERLDVKPILRGKYNLEDKKIVMGIGRFVEQKNFNLLISSMQKVVQNISDAVLVLVGDGVERNNLFRLTKELGLEDKVLFVGYQQNVGPFLKDADLLVVPSAYEGFGNVVLEALYCGVPAIVSPYVPSVEVVPGGTLVVENDRDKLARVIEKILSDKRLALNMVNKGKKEIEKVSFENHVQELKQIYAKLCTN